MNDSSDGPDKKTELPHSDLPGLVLDLERKKALLNTLNDFALKLMSIPGETELLWYVAREVVGKMGFVDCVIYRLTPGSVLLRQVAAIGVKNPYQQKIANALEIPVGQGITGHVAQTKAPLIVDDLRLDSRYIRDLEPARSEICVPLLNDDGVFGVIDCEDPRPNRFTTEHLEVLTTIAALTSAKLKMLDQTGAVRTRDIWLRAILDNAPIEIVLKDTSGRIMAVSHNVGEILGYPDADFIGRTTADFLPDDIAQRYMAADRQVVESGKPIQQEFREEIDRVVRHSLSAKFPLTGDTGEIIGVCSLTSDITEAKLAEDRLRQAQKMEAVGQLTGGVAHDFNNLLAIIQGNAEFLATLVGEESQEIQTILRASRRGGELTQRLLAFSRQQPLHPRPLDLGQIVAGMKDLLRLSLGEAVETEYSVATPLRPALADPGQVENAVLNLALNARDAMPKGGRLKIACSNARLDAAATDEMPEAVAGDYALLVVSDTGQGMSPEVLDHALEPFFTTKDVGQGSGLGLSMVYGFAKQSGGHLMIESEVGRGTSVKLYLPVAPAAAARVRQDATDQPHGQGEMVLVVEDDPDVRAMVVMMLKGLNYRVIEASGTDQARDALATHAKVAAMLCDVILPGPLKGPQFAANVVERRPDIKVVFMSGYPDDPGERHGLLDGKNSLLTKPFTRSALAAALQDALATTE